MAGGTPDNARRVLTTGGAGFIGSHLIELLVAEGLHVVILDNLSSGSADNLRTLPRTSYTLYEGSVEEILPELRPEDFVEIYHLASAVGVRKVLAEEFETIESSVVGTSALLKFATEAGVPTLIASSSEVYGKPGEGKLSEGNDLIIGRTGSARWAYAHAKAICEHLGLARFRQQGLPVRVVRFFNTVGPRQIGRYGMVLPRFVEAALAGNPLEVYGDGSQTRCFCDVRDVAPTLPVLMRSAEAAGEVINVGSDRPISIQALAELVVDVLDSDSEIRLVPFEEVFGADFEEPTMRRPDLAKLWRLTGRRERLPLERTILDIAAHMRATTASSGARYPSESSWPREASSGL